MSKGKSKDKNKVSVVGYVRYIGDDKIVCTQNKTRRACPLKDVNRIGKCETCNYALSLTKDCVYTVGEFVEAGENIHGKGCICPRCNRKPGGILTNGYKYKDEDGFVQVGEKEFEESGGATHANLQDKAFEMLGNTLSKGEGNEPTDEDYEKLSFALLTQELNNLVAERSSLTKRINKLRKAIKKHKK